MMMNYWANVTLLIFSIYCFLGRIFLCASDINTVLSDDNIVPIDDKIISADELTTTKIDTIPSLLNFDLNSVFFDANSTKFTKDGTVQIFEGDVVIIGKGILITADIIEFNQNKNILEAKGHVVILSANQIFLGDKVNYDIKSSDFLLTNGMMIYNDPKKVEEISRKVLGFGLEEIEYEQKRSQRLQNIEKRKLELKQYYRNKFFTITESQQQDIINRYALLLEQEDMLKKADNPYLSRLSEEQRKRYKIRRTYWEQNKKQLLNAGHVPSTSFFVIKGNSLERKNLNDYIIQDAYWSSCKCDLDENPDWGLSASQIFAQPGGYVDLYNSVLEIKGIPVLYLPYIKLPFKYQRQSGFLIPTISSKQSSGFVLSQPVFFVISDKSDATFTTQLHEKRGTKLGIEYRVQNAKYSGWSLNLEGIRDKEWMSARKLRKDILSYWIDQGHINEICTDQTNYDSCVHDFKMRFKVPSNDWRSSLELRGLSILSPRLSVVGHATLQSDHRYTEDLKILDDLESAFSESGHSIYFNTSKIRLHYDNQDYYLALGSSFGDSVLMDYRYQGYQIPLYFKGKTRYFLLTSKNFMIPIYVSLDLDNILIKDIKPSTAITDPSLHYDNGTTLSDGSWNRVALNQLTPIWIPKFMSLNHFSTIEYRYIQHTLLSDDKNSYITSLLSGLHLNIPLIGTMPLFQNSSYKNIDDTKNFLKHQMSWGSIFSVRPYVKRRGDYAKTFTDNQYSYELVYFASDRTKYISDLNDISADNTMVKHQKITFYTSQSWSILKRGFVLLDNKVISNESDFEQKYETLSYIDKARYELQRSLAQYPKLDDKTNINEGFEDKILGDYKLTNISDNTFASLYSTISYDFWLAKERQKILKLKRFVGEQILEKDLPQPWSLWQTSIGLYFLNLNFSINGDYNIYYKDFIKRSFGLTLPYMYSSQLNLGYILENEPDFDDTSGQIRWIRTHTYTGYLNSSYFKNFDTFLYFARRIKLLNNKEDSSSTQVNSISEYESKIGINYYAPSGCWGLSFLRWKKFNLKENEAEYWLRLSILFLGNKRDLPGNFAAPITKKINQ